MNRLFSLDVLRGFDMLLLLYGSVIAWALKDFLGTGPKKIARNCRAAAVLPQLAKKATD